MYSMVVKYKDDTEWASHSYLTAGEAMNRFLTSGRWQENVKEVVIKGEITEQD